MNVNSDLLLQMRTNQDMGCWTMSCFTWIIELLVSRRERRVSSTTAKKRQSLDRAEPFETQMVFRLDV